MSLFEVGFPKIASTLAEYGVDIGWGEKERHRAISAWQRWSEIDQETYGEIAHKLLSDIEPQLRENMRVTLNNSITRKVNEVEITVETNFGESRRYTFPSIAAALEFLQSFDEQEVLNDENGPVLWEQEKELWTVLEEAGEQGFSA